MRIICVLNAHEAPVLLDTIDSIRKHLTEDIVVVVDGAKRDCLAGHVVPANVVQGFIHGAPKSPYRNTTLGLKMAYQKYPRADWYCYIEYDCLAASAKVKGDLAALPPEVLCAGNDLRLNPHINLDFAKLVVKKRLPDPTYLLGCCVFYRHALVSALAADDIFDRLLWYTNDCSQGYFPLYNGYDVAEHLFPTLAVHYGGEVRGFARYREATGRWEGDSETYPMRWRPDLETSDPHERASILHPLKSLDHPIRKYYRELRNAG